MKQAVAPLQIAAFVLFRNVITSPRRNQHRQQHRTPTVPLDEAPPSNLFHKDRQKLAAAPSPLKDQQTGDELPKQWVLHRNAATAH